MPIGCLGKIGKNVKKGRGQNEVENRAEMHTEPACSVKIMRRVPDILREGTLKEV